MLLNLKLIKNIFDNNTAKYDGKHLSTAINFNSKEFKNKNKKLSSILSMETGNSGSTQRVKVTTHTSCAEKN